jgi:hypothetical protein
LKILINEWPLGNRAVESSHVVPVNRGAGVCGTFRRLPHQTPETSQPSFVSTASSKRERRKGALDPTRAATRHWILRQQPRPVNILVVALCMATFRMHGPQAEN